MRKILVLVFALLVAFALVACNEKDSKKYNANVPTITNASATYATLDSYTLTNGELYNLLRAYGYNTFMDEIYSAAIPAEGISVEANHDELEEMAKKDCYGVADPSTLTEQGKQNKETAYIDTMALNGIACTADAIFSNEVLAYYLPSLIAKKYAKSLILDSTSAYYYANEYKMENGEYILDEAGKKISNPCYISEDSIKDKYESSYKDGSFQAIIVAYNTIKEAEAAVTAAGGTINTDGSFTLTKANFDTLYANAFGYKDANYELDSDAISGFNASFQTLINNLKADEYTSRPQEFGDLAYLVYKVSEKATVELTDALKEEIKGKMIDALVTDSFTNTVKAELVTKLDNEGKITIYDPLYDALFELTTGTHSKLEASKWSNDYANKIATVNGKEITADAFYAKLEKVYGISTSLDYFTNKIMVANLANPDYKYQLTSDEIASAEIDYKADMDAWENGDFEGSYPKSLGKENFKYLYYGATSEEDIKNLFKVQILKEKLTKDFPDDIFTIMSNYGKQYAEKYYCLNVKHILLFVDYDLDGSPDDPEEFKALLDDTNKAAFENALVSIGDTFVKEVKYLYDTQKYCSLSEALTFVAKQYSKGEKIYSTGANWDTMKAFGIQVKVEDLGSVSTSNGSNYVTEFTNGVIDLYKELKLAGKASSNYIPAEITAVNELIQTSYGYHILGSLGTTSLSTAKYSEASDTARQYELITSYWGAEKNLNEDGEIIAINAYNEETYPNENQLKIYFEIKFNEGSSSNLPANVKNVIEYYFSKVMDRFQDSTFQDLYFAYKNITDKINYADDANDAKYTQYVEIRKRTFDQYADYSEESNQIAAGFWNYFMPSKNLG